MNGSNAQDAAPAPEDDKAVPDTAATQDAVTDAATPARSKPRRSLAGGLALILAAIALLATAYLWYLLSEKQQLIGADVLGRLTKVEQGVGELTATSAKAQQDIAALKETQDAIKGLVQNLSSDLNQNRGDWVLAEVEQLLLIASQRLQLAYDVELALVALKAADRRLRLLSSPNLLPVRKALASDIRQLQSLDLADVPGIALQLGTISNEIVRLPLAMHTVYQKSEPAASAASEPQGNKISRFFREIWNDLRSLIRIRRSDAPRKPLLAPEQEYFLRQNLRLMLSGAQLAALQRDQATFEQNLAAARNWLGEYFEPSSQPVAKILADLEAMKKAKLKPELPDVTSSLAALQRATGKRVAP